jgi:Ca2+-binding EF-hand superfamily protein
MTATFRTLLFTVVGVALAHAAAAQPPADRNPVEMMKRADTDGDGKVSRDEFIRARTADIEAMFGRIDADGDGTLDEQEVTTAAERMRGMGPGGRRPDGQRPPRPDGERPPRPGSGPGGEEAFNRLDRDGDGRLSREEFDEGMARMREFMQRGGPGPGMPDRGGRGPEQGFRRPPQQD